MLVVRVKARKVKTRETCYDCNKAGHLAKDCWHKGNGKRNQGSSPNKNKGDHTQREKVPKALRLKAKEKVRTKGEQLAEGEEWAELAAGMTRRPLVISSSRSTEESMAADRILISAFTAKAS